ncbi:phosphinothricin acetyltransferase [Methanomicrobium sp. W14]|uniref:GNAT family N-acetyltransferase n=1 Tax=Methanomicrobium sp. W14 TaxID=2817839 RepID=UPI001AE8AD06|nr:GNAT family N-acetyltransferase [Methanomicrobium sp. W14]MBP2133553.1 phosphinothricin acetyltransferase [Methanomicrobium sp. W14]
MREMDGLNYGKICEDDRNGIIDIFNWYIENSFAAYPENKVSYEFFDNFLEISQKYPSVSVKDEKGNILGFGMLRPHSPVRSFSHTAKITYFIKPGYTGRGIGKEMLNSLQSEGKDFGIKVVIAGISSKNTGSIHFHEKNGFLKCGIFPGVMKKNVEYIDEVWMYKQI